MLLNTIGTLKDSDYDSIGSGIQLANTAISELQRRGAKIVVACPQRWWEYGTAIQMLSEHFIPKRKWEDLAVLDVGSGWSGLGPALNFHFNTPVSEYEPVAEYRRDRLQTNTILQSMGKTGTFVHDFDMKAMPTQDYDAVFCVSVMEHVAKDVEKQCWKELAARVRKGGLLFITCDVVEDNTIPHTFDEMRVMPNFTMKDMKDRVEMLMKECGMKPWGMPDYKYNGNKIQDFHGQQTFDFTFFRAGFERV